MIDSILYSQFESLKTPIIDVRSPSEFKEGHIPGAINIPLLNDDHRRQIGIAYKQKGKEAAITLGYQLVNPIRESFLIQLIDNTSDKNIRIYCARGGLRSQLMSQYFSENGYNITHLKGGYKAYRNVVLKTISSYKNLKILAGYTGSGKTEILNEMMQLGAQVLDLEHLANHRGSAFGFLGQKEQPSSSHFHNLIYDAIKHFNHQQPIWVESESVNIGKAYLPKELWENMKQADGIEIILPVEVRAAHTLKLYGGFEKSLLAECIMQLSKRIAKSEITLLCALTEIGDLEPVVERLLKYYDKAYEHGREKRNCQNFVKLNFERLEPKKIAKFLLEKLMHSEDTIA